MVPVSKEQDISLVEALRIVLEFSKSLPAERKEGEKWIYHGLCGPLDQALIELVAAPSTTAGGAVVDAMVAALRKVDRNCKHRTKKQPVKFKLLPGAWAMALLDEHGVHALSEMRLALAVATLYAEPFLPYWLGVKKLGRYWQFPQAAPFQRVWGGRLTGC